MVEKTVLSEKCDEQISPEFSHLKFKEWRDIIRNLFNLLQTFFKLKEYYTIESSPTDTEIRANAGGKYVHDYLNHEGDWKDLITIISKDEKPYPLVNMVEFQDGWPDGRIPKDKFDTYPISSELWQFIDQAKFKKSTFTTSYTYEYYFKPLLMTNSPVDTLKERNPFKEIIFGTPNYYSMKDAEIILEDEDELKKHWEKYFSSIVRECGAPPVASETTREPEMKYCDFCKTTPISTIRLAHRAIYCSDKCKKAAANRRAK